MGYVFPLNEVTLVWKTKQTPQSVAATKPAVYDCELTGFQRRCASFG